MDKDTYEEESQLSKDFAAAVFIQLPPEIFNQAQGQGKGPIQVKRERDRQSRGKSNQIRSPSASGLEDLVASLGTALVE